MRRQVALPEALDATRDSFATSHLKEISYYVGGPEDGRPLVLLHSINAAPSAFEMKPLYDHYRATRRVYVPELPGFGFSDRSDRPYSPELYANAIIAFLTNVVQAPADVIAFSLSSEFAARAALSASERFLSLTLLSPTGFSARKLPSGGVGRAMHSVFTLPGLGQGLYQLLTKRPSIRYFLQRSYVGTPPEAMVDYAYATSHQPGARHAPYYFLAGQLFTRQATETLYAKLQLPVLVLYDRDANVGFELLADLVASHSNWKAVRIVPTLGIPQWERTADCSAALDAFWAEQG
ncbi:alpha/beta hydrolase [Lamprobacter modestohalophilus]|uniref:Alpha/beta hydrolase n=2 Tax=Lamprobacter modestohalophilus TaxID=1064514 RepID=A0A9X0W8M0_9GAMM|nr:alpha/beta hydrolase [Lamprobacter modestohalophilus]MCF7995205.1 alpha/beta fold hydrolase [Chromatiaceae bacterium]MCF8015130.1 alpha/beta fold hydrolase [Chromatiaceae bacterium]